MIDWSPILEEGILEKINSACRRMSPAQERLWNVIRITPEKWRLSPWGDPGGGFWVVAIFGSSVVWYNDIEEGFNRSTYSLFGTIERYWCNQSNLEDVIQSISNEIHDGYDSGPYGSPPRPL